MKTARSKGFRQLRLDFSEIWQEEEAETLGE
jgi:hypothetical protein